MTLDGSEKSTEKPKADPLRPDDIDGNDKGVSSGEARGSLSGEVVPAAKKEAAVEAVKAVEAEGGFKLSEIKKETDSKDWTSSENFASGIHFISAKLEREILTNENAKNSRFVQGAYALCKMFESWGFSFTAGDYSFLSSALYPTERIEFKDGIQIKEFLTAREKLKLLDDYHKTKLKLATTSNSGDKQTLQKKLDGLKTNIAANFETGGNDPDALYEKYLAKDKEALKEEELKKFKDSENIDEQVSSYYVQQQLGILGYKKEGQNENYDILALYARLKPDHTAYHNTADTDKSSRGMFKHEEDPSAFFTSLDAGTLPVGTVLFFKWQIANKKTALLCGVTGLDGKIRFHDSKGLHTFGRGKSDAEKHVDQVLGPKDKKEEDFDADLNLLSGSFFGVDMLPTTSFAGAFIPPAKDETETKTSDESKEAKPGEEAKPAEGEAKKEEPKSEPEKT